MPAEDFIRDFIVKNLNAKSICVGFNFKFGYKREGDVHLIKALEDKYNYKAFVQDAVLFDDLPVSSTRIRSALYEGHITLAKNLLGEWWTLKGKVEKGRAVGRTMGYPTANITFDKNQILPAYGVYVTLAEIEGRKYFAGCNVGIKPTFGLNYVTVEPHFINMDPNMDLYDKEINLSFVKKFRDEIEFPTTEALVERIKKDRKIVEEYSKIL